MFFEHIWEDYHLKWYDIHNLQIEARYLVKISLHHHSRNNVSYITDNCKSQTVEGTERKELLFRDDKRLHIHTNISESINQSISSFCHTILRSHSKLHYIIAPTKFHFHALL